MYCSLLFPFRLRNAALVLLPSMVLCSSANNVLAQADFAANAGGFGLVKLGDSVTIPVPFYCYASGRTDVHVHFTASEGVTVDPKEMTVHGSADPFQTSVTLSPTTLGCTDPANSHSYVEMISAGNSSRLYLYGQVVVDSMPRPIFHPTQDTVLFPATLVGTSSITSIGFRTTLFEPSHLPYPITIAGNHLPFSIDKIATLSECLGERATYLFRFRPNKSGSYRDTVFFTTGENFADSSRVVLIGQATVADVISPNARPPKCICYPNPARDRAFTIAGSVAIKSIRIYNVLGAIISDISITTPEDYTYEIRTEKMESGIYRVLIVTAEDTQALNLIVSK